MPHGLERRADPVDGAWLHVVKPEPADLDALHAFGAPHSLLDQVHDADERPRVEITADCLLVVLQYPAPAATGDGPPWRTLPLHVLLTPRGVATVALEPPPFLVPILAGDKPAPETTPEAFVLRIGWYIADAYLNALRQINQRVDGLEDELRRSLRNKEVLGLLQHQKSLTFFATGLKSNELMLERLEAVARGRLDSASDELLAEVRIEMRQAIEMVQIAYTVLSDMMDAFASIVSNNLNAVMKVLTSVTILLAVPTLIASIYGMNVPLPWAHRPGVFAGLVLASAALCGALMFLFRRRRWL